MAVISFLGPFGGGRNVIPFYWDLVWVAVWSLIVYGAMALRHPGRSARARRLSDLRGLRAGEDLGVPQAALRAPIAASAALWVAIRAPRASRTMPGIRPGWRRK
jgi:hypothetical protein